MNVYKIKVYLLTLVLLYVLYNVFVCFLPLPLALSQPLVCITQTCKPLTLLARPDHC